jgi:hypothetical protein
MAEMVSNLGKLKILWFNWRCWLNPAMGGAPFLNFNNSQTTITYNKNGEVNTVKVSELQVKEMHIENFRT